MDNDFETVMVCAFVYDQRRLCVSFLAIVEYRQYDIVVGLKITSDTTNAIAMKQKLLI